jgi:polyisoprenyl-teichoic acid--peptidoglycan teichoic acid transferase
VVGVTSTHTGTAPADSDADATGPERQAARQARDRRRQRYRLAGLVLLGLLVALVTAVATVLLASWLDRPGAPHAPPGATAGPPQQTLLLVQHDAEERQAGSVTLLASGEDETRGLVLFVPVGTLMDVPGVGLDQLGLALQYGGTALVQSTVENALGVQIDHAAEVTDAGLAAWLDRVGGLDVEVPERLVHRRDDGSADVRFEAGSQRLDGARLAELWRFRQRGEDELATLPRQQRVLEALFATADDGEQRARLLEGGPPQLATEAEEAWLDDLFEGLGQALEDERLRFSILPVEPFGGQGPGGAAYRLRDADARDLVRGHLAGSMPVGGGPEATRVQVLNGVGVPGIGQEVDRRLERGAFRIILSDNARSFDFDTTQIIVYEETEPALAAARRVQELLGVGTIRVSRQPQSVVDLTIVVGADFVEEQDGDGAEAGAGDEDPTE